MSDGPTEPAVVLAALERCLATADRPVPLHEPRFAGKEWDYVKECLDTGWVSSAGSFVDAFETMVAGLTGARHAVAVVNGTAGLHLALIGAGVDPGDEVLVPTLTFVATANAVRHAGGVPHLCDVERARLGIDPVRLEEHLSEVAERDDDGATRNRSTGARIRALVPMHALGHPADLDGLAALAERWGLALIEDAAQALGSTAGGRHVGHRGLAGVLSFNGNKIITTGGGGAILSNDDAFVERVRHIGTTARVAHRWELEHDAVGWNSRLPNLNAALGCAQLEVLDERLAAKRELTARYTDAFVDVDGASILQEPAGARSNYWLNAIVLDEPDRAVRDALLEVTNDAGIVTRPLWTPMHRLPMFADAPRMTDLTTAERLVDAVVSIPSSAHL